LAHQRIKRAAAFLAALFISSVAAAGAAWGFAIESPSNNQVQAELWYADYTGTPCGGQGLKFSGGLVWTTCKISYTIDTTTADAVTRNGWSLTVSNAANDWATWDATKSRWTASYFGPDNCSGANDVNCQVVIAHMRDLGPPDPVNGSGILGSASYTAVCPPSAAQPCAMQFADVYANSNPGWNWYVDALGGSMGSTQYSLQEVYEHELGHGLGLAHPVLNDAGGFTAVMECYVHQGVLRRIATDDRNGIGWLYSGHAGWGSPTAALCSGT
jgi:hypothetical protein